MDRIFRISEEMKKEISSIIQNELKDPRLPKMISVMSADVTKDLRHAKVFVSVYGTAEDRANAIEALKSASGFIRREIGHRMQLRLTPELHFELDNSIEHGVYITKLINDTMKESHEHELLLEQEKEQKSKAEND
ncbi:MAG: 30S ribosome-binding factor RbfA [Clostridiales bacterium]|nr:30S ribosome-binding factor RbfA [Clostridiales bacterium]